MRSFSVNDINVQDVAGSSIVDPIRLVRVLEEFRREIEQLEKRLKTAEYDISDLKWSFWNTSSMGSMPDGWLRT